MNDLISLIHTPEEIVRLSNLAHSTEGILMILLGILLVAKPLGYLQKKWQVYLLPGVSLLASLILFGFLFTGHFNEFPLAWKVMTTDMQQQQHLLIGLILGSTSLITILGLRLGQYKLTAAMSFGLLAIGILFLIHLQHGNGESFKRALFTHRAIGISIIVGWILHAGGVFIKRWHRQLSILSSLGFIIAGFFLMSYREPLVSRQNMDISTTQSHGGAVRDYVSFIDTLRSKGSQVTPAGEIAQSFFSVSGNAITVNEEQIQVFEYASMADANKDVLKVSKDGTTIANTMISWVAPPHFYQKDRIIVLYVGNNQEIRYLLDSIFGKQFAGG